MANIDVQKKRANPLPWILLLLVVLGIVGYFIWRNMDGTAATTTTDSTTTTTIDTTRP